jgi:hypothetical protein
MAISPSSPVFILVAPHTSRTRFPRFPSLLARAACVSFSFHSSTLSALIRRFPRRIPCWVYRAETAQLRLQYRRPCPL